MHIGNSLLAAVALTTASLHAQTVTAPAIFANSPGGTSGNIWRAGQALNQSFYDTTNFTSQGLDYPVIINNLEWRLGSGLLGAAVTYPTVEIYLGYSAVDYLAPSTTFATNRSASHTLVYSGAVSVSPAAGTTPNSWVINLPLATTFTYDPTLGQDLLLEIRILASPTPLTGSTMDCGSNTAAHFCNSMRSTSSGTATTGAASAFAPIVRFGYANVPGTALNTSYGAGCGAIYGSFYQNWSTPTAPAAALSNTSISLDNLGSTYQVSSGGGTYLTPSGTATVLALADDAEVSVPLSGAMPYPGGTTSALMVCSNGFVSAAAGNGTNWVPTGNEMLNMPQTVWMPLWTDWNPAEAGSGSIKAEEIAGVMYITWENVERYAGAPTVNPATMQIQFDIATGNVKYVYETITPIGGATGDAHQVGYSPGGASPNPGSIDLATSLPFVLPSVEEQPLALSASPRAVLGATVTYTISNINPGALISAHLISLGGVDPGIDLTGMGAPGCSQYVDLSIAATILVVGAPTATTTFNVPNVPAFVGLPLDNQAASLIVGINALGVATSNGVASLIGSL